MTLEEILADVDLRVPNEITVEQKVRWINQVQRQLFRDYPLPDAVALFVTVPGLPWVILPEDCQEDRIRNVTVDDEEYPFRTLSENAPSKFWTMIAGQMMLYPTPEEEMEVMIYYEPSHVELSADDLAVTPSFPEDYHELLVLGCAVRVAKAQKDVALANSLDADYAELAAKADREFERQDPGRIIDALGGWWS